jgi:hypothetical protein
MVEPVQDWLQYPDLVLSSDSLEKKTQISDLDSEAGELEGLIWPTCCALLQVWEQQWRIQDEKSCR